MISTTSFLCTVLLLHCVGAYDYFIDEETPDNARQIMLSDGMTPYELVFSDEFNVDGRKFADGEDIKWTALDHPDTSNAPQVYYSPDQVTTKDGNLVITTSNEPASWHSYNDQTDKEEVFTRYYRSGMVQGWNKVCFSGGIVEIRVRLPGRSDIGGLWPAAWLMGNLGRATYMDSTNKMWPLSYDKCRDDNRFNQRISACDESPGFGLNPKQGRGAAELDIFEAQATPDYSLISSSLQIAPKLPARLQPEVGTMPAKGQWYQGLSFAENATINKHFYGSPYGDAISSTKPISQSLYDKFHTFRLEWVRGAGGTIRWYLDGKFFYEILADSLEVHLTEVPPRMLPAEPMYMILNTAMSTTWSLVCDEQDAAAQRCPPGNTDKCCSIFPAEYKIDYVRVYQDPNLPDFGLDCSPETFPTSDYIHENADLYGGELLAVRPPETYAQRRFARFAIRALAFLAGVVMVLALGRILFRRVWYWSMYSPISDKEDVFNPTPNRPLGHTDTEEHKSE